MWILAQNYEGCLQLLKKKNEIWKQVKRQASKRVGNDSADTIGQICKAAYAPFHKRAVVYGTSVFLYASAR